MHRNTCILIEGTGMNSVGAKRARPSSLAVAGQETVERRGLRCQDIRQILPTCCILILTVVIMVTVIPYAFSNAIK